MQPAERIDLVTTPWGVIALNMDGGVSCSVGIWGFVSLLYDHHGDFLHGYYGSSGDLSIIDVEILIIFCGLQLWWDIGYRKAAYFLDTFLVIDLVKSDIIVIIVLSQPSNDFF